MSALRVCACAVRACACARAWIACRLTPEQERRASTVFTVLFALMILAQLGLVYWKKKRYKSYLQVTLVGLWLIPFVFSEFLHFYKFLFIWTVYSIACGFIMYR